MIKKLTSLALALVMCLSLCVPAFASTKIERQIQAEIQQEEERIWANVYQQLEAQDALSLMETVQEALRPDIEANVRARYGVNVSTYAATSYRFPNGGYVAYRSTLGTNVIKMGLNQEDTKTLLIDNTYSVSGIFLALMGTMPAFGLWFGAIGVAQAVANYTAKKDIDAANGYSTVLYVEADDGDRGTVISGWYSYSTLNIHDYERITGSGSF